MINKFYFKQFVYLGLFAFIMLSPKPLFGNTDMEDSLLTILKFQKDTARINTLNKLAWHYNSQLNQKAEVMAISALEEAKMNNYHEGVNDAHRRLADYYRNSNQFPKALEHLIAILKTEKITQDTVAILKTYIGLGNLYIRIDDNKKAKTNYTIALELAIKIANWKYFAIVCNNLGQVAENQSDFITAKDYYLKGLAKEKPSQLTTNYLNLLQNIGSAHYYLDAIDSAFYYNNQVKQIATTQNNARLLAGVYQNEGVYLEGENDYRSAIVSYKKGLTYAQETKDSISIQDLYANIMLCYGYLGNVDSIDLYYEKYYYLNQDNIKAKTNKAIHELSIQYDVEKKEQSLILANNEKEKMELSNELKQTAIYILLAVIAIIGLLVFIFYILYQEKQKLIKLQIEAKNNQIEGLIRDQEIRTYKAQLDGIEKERKRVAQDLHDKIGGLLATVKLQFEGGDGLNPQAIDNIKSLVNESIKSVRTISHNLSDGRVEEMGLEQSILDLKNSFSTASAINFDLYLEDYSEVSSLEIEREIFKIILELLSNTLKHAQASNIVLQLNTLSHNIHLTFEDNGIGFDQKLIKKGVGMQSISRRVDRINGTWYIDSKLGHGSTVVIKIPFT